GRLTRLPDRPQREVAEPGHDRLVIEILADESGAPEFRSGAVTDPSIRHARDTISLEMHVRRHVERRADAVKLVEPVSQRTAAEGLREIDVLGCLTGAHPVQAKVPFAEDAGTVAVI